MADLKAGWSPPPPGGRKWHYFREGKHGSLCCKIGFNSDENRADSNHESKDNCTQCMKLRQQ